MRRGYAERRGDLRVKATAEGLAFLAGGMAITSGPNGPRVMETDATSLRTRLWKAIRLAQKASVSDLLELAARGHEGNAALNAKEYLRALEKSGHLMRLSRRAPSEWPVTTGEPLLPRPEHRAPGPPVQSPPEAGVRPQHWQVLRPFLNPFPR